MRNTNPDKTPVTCPVCFKLFNGPRALKSHNTQVHINVNRDNSKRGSPLGRIPWNKGLSKETDNRLLNISNIISKRNIDRAARGEHPKMGDLAKAALSERQSLNNTGGRCKWYYVGEQKVQGTYERDFAIALENQNIKWQKVKTNNHIFKYIKNGKVCSYAPDIFLPELNLYIEIKGFWWGDDENKMISIKQQHIDKNVVIIFGRDRLNFIMQDIKKLILLEPVWSW